MEYEKEVKNKEKQQEEDQEDFDQQLDDQEIEDVEDDEEDEEEDISFMQKYNLTSKKIGKIMILLVMLSVIVWLVLVGFEKLIFSAKKFSKMSSDVSMQQYSGLDEQGWRSYYYFTKMQQMARDNANNNKKFDLSLAMNKFGQVSFSELLSLFKVLKSIQFAKGYNTSLQNQKNKEDINQTIDEDLILQPYNYTSYFGPAVDQYSCASCYSFPIAATIQFLYKKHYNISIKLSEQQLIDCSMDDDLVDGCKEGNITKGFQYAQRVGLVERDHYPYRSKGGNSYPCRKEIVNNSKFRKYKIDGFRILPKENCMAIQVELSQGNTVAVMMALQSARELSKFREKDGRPFRNCPKQPFGHALTIVGQTVKNDWIVRNSWGISWGINGYFTLKGGNTCSVCQYAIVPYLNAPKGGV